MEEQPCSFYSAALGGLIAGFLLANSINRNELSTLRAENDRLKTQAPQIAKDSRSDLTDEEINETIAKADQNPDDFDTQRNVGVAIYRYGAMKQDEKLIRQRFEYSNMPSSFGRMIMM